MTCTLLPGIFGIFVQGLLFATSCGVLVYKFHREQGKNDGSVARTWPTFLMDSSKQLAGAAWIHVMNMVCAHVLGVRLQGDGCHWYWVEIVIDTTVGVGVNFVLLKTLTFILKSLFHKKSHLFDSGSYRDEKGDLQKSRYVVQFLMWMTVVTIMKLSLVLLVAHYNRIVYRLASAALMAVDGNPQAELVVVMILTPVTMNAVQFWIQDSFLKFAGAAKVESSNGIDKQLLAA